MSSSKSRKALDKVLSFLPLIYGIDPPKESSYQRDLERFLEVATGKDICIFYDTLITSIEDLQDSEEQRLRFLDLVAEKAADDTVKDLQEYLEAK